MTHVAYRGPYDSWSLGAADMKRAGVEDFTKTTFKHNQPVEVDDQVAEALTTKEDLFGQNFVVVDEGEAEEAELIQEAGGEGTVDVPPAPQDDVDPAATQESTGPASARRPGTIPTQGSRRRKG